MSNNKNIDIHSRQEDVSPFYNNATVVVNLSDKEKFIETFGMTALESMSAGVPIIVPTEGGIAEMVDGQNGYKIDVQDLPKIEEAVTRMLSDKSLYMKMSENALAKSKEYDIDAMILKIENILCR